MKMYTAQEMRVRADYLEGALADAKTAAMLRQAADMMEREATREGSSQVGNAAKMREALVKSDTAFRCITKSAWFFDANFAETKEVMDAGNAIESALSAPPRNCDVCNTVDDAIALAIHHGVVDCGFGAREMAEFLLAEAKGETDGRR